jgi:hypothetical protein
MLGEAEAAGLPLPHALAVPLPHRPLRPGQRVRRSGAGRWFVFRHRRKVGLDPSERVHPTARGAAEARGIRVPVPRPGGVPPATA